MTDELVRWTLAKLFRAEFRREWWRRARESYELAPRRRRERQFVAMVEEEYQRACKAQETFTENDKKPQVDNVPP